jgi:hypothetical protein
MLPREAITMGGLRSSQVAAGWSPMDAACFASSRWQLQPTTLMVAVTGRSLQQSWA